MQSIPVIVMSPAITAASEIQVLQAIIGASGIEFLRSQKSTIRNIMFAARDFCCKPEEYLDWLLCGSVVNVKTFSTPSLPHVPWLTESSPSWQHWQRCTEGDRNKIDLLALKGIIATTGLKIEELTILAEKEDEDASK